MTLQFYRVVVKLLLLLVREIKGKEDTTIKEAETFLAEWGGW